MPRLLKKDWIVAYSEAVDLISEAPKQYNVWSAISVIGSVLKKSVWISHGDYVIYPNQYVILTGPPGVGKGTALHGCYAFAKELNLINPISDRITAPKIIERLANGVVSAPVITPGGGMVMPKDSTAVLMSPELSTLLSSSDWMLTLLCDCWDRGEYEYDTKNCGTSTVKGMCVSLIGGCVPDYIRKINKDTNSAVSSGFTARSIFVYAEEPSKKLPWPKKLDSTKAGKDIRDKLLNDLAHIATLKGEITITPQAMKTFENWYRNKLINKPTDSQVMQYFKARVKVHVLKLAMIFCCAGADGLVIQDHDMIMAIISLGHVQENLDKAFRGVGDSDIAQATAIVQNFMEKAQVATRQEIYMNVYKDMTVQVLDLSIHTLIMIKFMVENTVGNQSVYQVIKKGGIAATTPQVLSSTPVINLNPNGNGKVI